MVSGAGDGAAIENIAPVMSIRVDGPGASRISKFSTKSDETICMALIVGARPSQQYARLRIGLHPALWDAKHDPIGTCDVHRPKMI